MKMFDVVQLHITVCTVHVAQCNTVWLEGGVLWTSVFKQCKYPDQFLQQISAMGLDFLFPIVWRKKLD